MTEQAMFQIADLENDHVRIEPLEARHRDMLVDLAATPNVFVHTPLIGGSPQAYVDWAYEMAGPRHRPNVIFAKTAEGLRPVGMSRFFDIDMERLGLEIGFTWLIPDVWGTLVNPSIKYLMMRQCFEGNGIERVQYATDIRNEHSQAAIAKLGALREGVRRCDRKREDGSWRDTVVFSILAEEWPMVGARLLARIDELNRKSAV